MIILAVISIILGLIAVRILDKIEENRLLVFDSKEFKPGCYLLKIFICNIIIVFALSVLFQVLNIHTYYFFMNDFIHALITIFSILFISAGITIFTIIINDLLFKHPPAIVWRNPCDY